MHYEQVEAHRTSEGISMVESRLAVSVEIAVDHHLLHNSLSVVALDRSYRAPSEADLLPYLIVLVRTAAGKLTRHQQLSRRTLSVEVAGFLCQHEIAAAT